MYKILICLFLCSSFLSCANYRGIVKKDKQFSATIDSLYRADTLGMSQLFSKEKDLAFRGMVDSAFRNAAIADSIVREVKKELFSFWEGRDSDFRDLQDAKKYDFNYENTDKETLVKACTLANKYAMEGRYDKASELFNQLEAQCKLFYVTNFNYLSFQNELISFYKTNKIKELKDKIEGTYYGFISSNTVLKYLLHYSLYSDEVYKDRYIQIGEHKISLALKSSLDHEEAEYIDFVMKDVDSDGIKELIEKVGYGGSNAEGAINIYKQITPSLYSLQAHLSESCTIKADNTFDCFIPLPIISDGPDHFSCLQVNIKFEKDSFSIICQKANNRKIIENSFRPSIYSICLTWYYNNHFDHVGTKKLFNKLAKKMDLHDSECVAFAKTKAWDCFLNLKDKFTPNYFIHIKSGCPNHGLIREEVTGEACAMDDEYTDHQIEDLKMRLEAGRIFLEHFLGVGAR